MNPNANRSQTPARKDAAPAFQPLQLATLVDAAPAGADWLNEIKYDGYRVLLAIGGANAKAYTRSGLNWSDRFAQILEASAKLKAESALIDGEAVVLDEAGRSRFELMQGAFKSRSSKLVFYAFDLLEHDGEDLRKRPLLERKKRLVEVIGRRKTGVIRYSEHVVGKGDAFFTAACKQGLEGIIAKKATAPYVGARTEAWLKIKCIKRQEFVIAGWTPSEKKRGFRSLILAVNENGKLRYAGKVGTGFDMAEIERLSALMKPLARKTPTVEAPRAAVRDANWIEPKLVAEIAFTEMTSDGVLRHPSYTGLREDKSAREVVAERPMPIEAVDRAADKAQRSRAKKKRT